jgi:hypothetical protein
MLRGELINAASCGLRWQVVAVGDCGIPGRRATIAGRADIGHMLDTRPLKQHYTAIFIAVRKT